MHADATVDARGHKCPWGIVEMKKRFRTMAGGQVIELLSDDRVSAHEVPIWCELAGHTYLGSEEAGDYAKYYVRRRQD